MQNRPVFHLFIPYLLQSLNDWHQDFLFDVEAIHLSTLLTHSTKTNTSQSRSINSAFFQTLNETVEELPVAYYRHQVQLNEKLNELMCADPIHLEVSMNDVTLTDKITDLTDDEAKELIKILNQHFAQDGLEFIFGSNQCWYVSFAENETVQSHDLDSVLLQNIIDKSTKSERRNWQVIQNEAQMLLHSSDINQQREIAGLKTVNSLWFWGAGKPKNNEFEIENIYSNNNLSSMLRADFFAKAANCESHTLPENTTLLLEQVDCMTSTQVLLLDQLFMPALENTLDDFQQELMNIDKQIIKPLLEAWQKNEIDIVIDCCDGTVLKPQKVPVWKFWLKPKKLRELVE
ncbi:MAG: hypothetical protein V7749_14595 [Cocleimonas sp.]